MENYYKMNMACSCRLAFFILILSNIISTSEGMKFSHKKYVILLTPGYDKGPIGKINVDLSSSRVSYSIGGAKSLLAIDKVSGKLKLMRKIDDQVAEKMKNMKATIQAVKRGTSEKSKTTVIIVILPHFYGDRFIRQIGKITKSKVKKPHPKYTKLTSRSLLHFLRRPSETAQKISLAQWKFETKIMKVKQLIIKKIAKELGIDVANGIIQAYLHIKELFSAKIIEEMEFECEPPTVAKKCNFGMKFRTFDGTCNNPFYPNAGASDRAFTRILRAQYFDSDGLNDPIGYPDQPNAPSVPSPHLVSREFIKDEVAASSLSSTLTHAVMQFGQFLDHDLDLAVEVEFEHTDPCLDSTITKCDGSPSDFRCPCYPILPEGDARCIRVTRSAAVCQKHGYPKAREQINVNTAYIDASQIYGSTKRVADLLRETQPEDLGLLKSSNGLDGELLPLDPSLKAEEFLCNNLGGCFLAGDSRSNEQQSLAAFHSLFLREHNRIARALKKINDHWNGERLYQETRRIMGAVMQKITYKDYLPVVLGRNGLPRYKRYNPFLNPGVSNAFATGAYRFGHSLIRNSFDILNSGFNPIGDPIALRFMFFNNTFIQKNGISPILLGLVGNFSERVDRVLSAGIVQNLFERENSPGSNLAALNIHRSRDHGIPGYNAFRKGCGLKDAKTFEDTAKEIKDPENRKILKRLYDDNPNLVELWVAGLAETPVKRASVGPTFACVIANQFRRSRDGDRFYFERRGVWTRRKLAEIKKASLSRIYCDNLKVVSIQRNAFEAPTKRKRRINCDRIPGIDLCMWREHPYYRNQNPCLFGKLVLRKGKCICKCFKNWFGERCEKRRVKPHLKKWSWWW